MIRPKKCSPTGLFFFNLEKSRYYSLGRATGIMGSLAFSFVSLGSPLILVICLWQLLDERDQVLGMSSVIINYILYT